MTVAELDVVLNGRMEALEADLRQARVEIKAFARDAERETQRASRRLAEGAKETGRWMTTHLTAPILAAGAGAGKLAMDFDQALRNVDSIAKLTDKGFRDLHDSVLALASDPSIRQGPEDLARGLYDIYSSGFKGREALDVLRQSAYGASAGMTDTATASRVLTAVLNSGIGGVRTAKEAMNVLFREVDVGVNTFEQLANSLGDVLPTAATAKVPLQEVAAAFATMTKNGISASESSTSLNNLLLHIIKPSKDAAAAMREAGVSYGLAALESKGLTGWLQDVEAKLGHNKQALTEIMPEIRGLRGLLSLLSKDGKTYEESLKAMTTAQEGAGATASALERQNRGVRSEWQIAVKEFKIGAVLLGEELAPAVRDVSGYVRGFASWLRSLSPEQRKAVVEAALLTAALGPLVSGLGRVATGIRAIIGLRGSFTAAKSAMRDAAGVFRGGLALLTTSLARTRLFVQLLIATRGDFGATMALMRGSSVAAAGGIGVLSAAALYATGVVGGLIAAVKVYNDLQNGITEGHRWQDETTKRPGRSEDGYRAWMEQLNRQRGGTVAERMANLRKERKAWGLHREYFDMSLDEFEDAMMERTMRGAMKRRQAAASQRKILADERERLRQESEAQARATRDAARATGGGGRSLGGDRGETRGGGRAKPAAVEPINPFGDGYGVRDAKTGAKVTEEGLRIAKERAAEFREELNRLVLAKEQVGVTTDWEAAKLERKYGRYKDYSEAEWKQVYTEITGAERKKNALEKEAAARRQATEAAQEARRMAEDRAGRWRQELAERKRTLDLLGLETDAERTLYEIRNGSLKDANWMVKAYALALARLADHRRKDLDAEKAVAEAVRRSDGRRWWDVAVAGVQRFRRETQASQWKDFREYMDDLNKRVRELSGHTRGAAVSADVMGRSFGKNGWLAGVAIAAALRTERLERFREIARDAAESLSEIITGSLDDLAERGFGGFFSAVIVGFRRMLAQMAMEYLQSQLRDLLMRNLESAFRRGGWLSSILAGKREAGGPVSAGAPYLVGEAGPELFVPSGAGNVLTARDTSKLGGGGVTVNIHVSAPDPGSFHATMPQIMSRAQGEAMRAFRRNR